MRERVANIAPIAAVAGVLGLCCGLPVWLSLGVLGAAAGLSLQSWALIGVGLVLAVGGLVRLVKHQSSRDPGCDLGEPPASQGRALDQSLDTTTKGNHP